MGSARTERDVNYVIMLRIVVNILEGRARSTEVTMAKRATILEG